MTPDASVGESHRLQASASHISSTGYPLLCSEHEVNDSGPSYNTEYSEEGLQVRRMRIGAGSLRYVTVAYCVHGCPASVGSPSVRLPEGRSLCNLPAGYDI